MTATDELRAMLDERGVRYDKAATVIGETVATFWHDRDGYPCSAIEGADDIPDGEVSVQACVTPEQAIAATLGRGECHDKNGFDPELGFECTVCGAMVDTYMVTPMEMGHVRQFAYCPFCGARVVEVEE